MRVASKMQHAVHYQVRVMRGHALALGERLTPDDGVAQDHITCMKAQDIGRAVHVPESPIELASLAFADDAQGNR